MTLWCGVATSETGWAGETPSPPPPGGFEGAETHQQAAPLVKVGENDERNPKLL